MPAGLIVVLLIAACGGTSGSPRPSPSLVELDFTPQPTATGTPSAPGSPSPSASPRASGAERPEGFDAAFCTMFAEARIAQELIVDIERALDEGATRDARGLARELRQVAQNATVLIDEIPTWDEAAEALLGVATLLDLGDRAAAEYDVYLAEDLRAALRRARGLRRDNGDAVPETNRALDALVEAGLACPDGPLTLESP